MTGEFYPTCTTPQTEFIKPNLPVITGAAIADSI